MPIASVTGVELYYEDTGQGFPLVSSHEFGGDHRSWVPQVRYFARRYRVITYNTVNVEEPALFNSLSAEFLTAVKNGRWGTWEA